MQVMPHLGLWSPGTQIIPKNISTLHATHTASYQGRRGTMCTRWSARSFVGLYRIADTSLTVGILPYELIIVQ